MWGENGESTSLTVTIHTWLQEGARVRLVPKRIYFIMFFPFFSQMYSPGMLSRYGTDCLLGVEWRLWVLVLRQYKVLKVLPDFLKQKMVNFSCKGFVNFGLCRPDGLCSKYLTQYKYGCGSFPIKTLFTKLCCGWAWPVDVICWSLFRKIDLSSGLF